MPEIPANDLTIGSLAAAAGVGVETVRFYQRRGLLREPAREYGRVRRYTRDDGARIRFIKSAQRMGFSLTEVEGLLQLDDGRHCDEARHAAERKLALVRVKLADLERIEVALVTLVEACDAASGEIRCPLIDALQHEEMPHPSAKAGHGHHGS